MTQRLISLTLAMVLILTAQVLAVARGQAAAAGEMVICSGGERVSVLVDEQGQPIGAPHFCPDCALSLMDLSIGSVVPEIAPTEASMLVLPPAALTVAAIAAPNPSARGPPA